MTEIINTLVQRKKDMAMKAAQEAEAMKKAAAASGLTFIRRVVGDSTVRDMLELRAFFRCNNNLVGDYKVKI